MTEDVTARAPQSAAEQLEINQWVAERKSHFPTAANIARKQADAATVVAAGMPLLVPKKSCLLCPSGA